MLNVGLTGVTSYDRVYQQLKEILPFMDGITVIDYGLSDKLHENRMKIVKQLKKDMKDNYIDYAIIVCSCGLRTLANLSSVRLRGFIIKDVVDFLNGFKYDYKYLVFGNYSTSSDKNHFDFSLHT